MSDSIRQQIVDAIQLRLGTIMQGQSFTLPDGLYVCQNSIAGVYPWRKTPFSTREVPAIEFWDASAEVSPSESSRQEHELHIGLQILVAEKTPASTARSILADVTACIGSDARWGGLARWTNITGHGLVVEKAGDVIAAAQLSFTVIYRTPLWRL